MEVAYSRPDSAKTSKLYLLVKHYIWRLMRLTTGEERTKQNVHRFIVASFIAQSMKGNDMACKREISTLLKDNGVNLFSVTETWLSAQGDEGKTRISTK